MKTLTQIISRLAAFAGASAVGAAAPLLVNGNSSWWMAAVGAVIPHTALVVAEILKAYGSDGKLTQAEIDQAFGATEQPK
jgi:hypothetical protein